MDNSEVNSSKWGVEFANLFKNLEKKEKVGAVIGEIVGVEPLVVSILDGEIILNSTIHDIYISTNIITSYGRKFDSSGNISFSDSDCGTTTSDGKYPHTHEVASLNINTNYTLKGDITMTDGVNTGDLVLVIADESDSAFFIVSKLQKA